MPLPANGPLAEAVRKDFNAWTMYKRHGCVPGRLHSDGLDVSFITSCRYNDKHVA